MKNVFPFILMVISLSVAYGQKETRIDLPQRLKENKLSMNRKPFVPIPDSEHKAIAGDGLVWLTGENFSEGTIDIDLRGKDVFQKSFLGVAFHGVDSVRYDLIYFRPFNFRATDPVRKIHAVQYVSAPEFGWERLRTERNGQYEKGIDPAPGGTDWFHATIVVKGMDVNVYVNHQDHPSLTVKLLNVRTTGMIGLWNEGLDGNFANLSITR